MWLLVVLLILAFIALGLSWYTYKICFFSPRKGQGELRIPDEPPYQQHADRIRTLYKALQGFPCEPVSITSHDGLVLAGRYYHCQDGAPLDIGFHGYRSSGFADFMGGGDLSFSRGHNLLLVDQRAHGLSQGHTITFGLQERQDCLNWVSYAVNRFGADTKITLYGVSMGAATVLMAAGLPLPGNVRGIIADCPYANAGAIIRKVCKDLHYPAALTYPFIRLGAWLFGRFDLEETDALEAVQKSPVPILIIHGAGDDFVPPEMSAVVQQAAPHIVRRITMANAGHATSYLEDTPLYSAAVNEFWDEILSD